MYIFLTDSISKNLFTDFSMTVSFPIFRNCLEIFPPKRLLDPAAGMMTAILFFWFIRINFFKP